MFTHKDLTKPTYWPNEVAKFVNVHYRTVVAWDKKQSLFLTSTTGRRYMTKERLIELLMEKGLWLDTKDAEKVDVVYVRVSSQGQKQQGDLDRQISTIMTQASDIKNPVVVSDVGSGLNDKRRGLNQLIKKVIAGEVRTVYVTYKDRLTRFGFHYLEQMFHSYGVAIHVIMAKEDNSIEQELVDDMMSLIASFSGRLYGMRSGKNKQTALLLKQATQEVSAPINKLRDIMEGV